MIHNYQITRAIFLECVEAGVEYTKTHSIRPGSKPTKSRITESLDHALQAEKSGTPFERELLVWNNGSGSWMFSQFLLSIMPTDNENGIKLVMLHKAVMEARDALLVRWHNEPPKVDGMIFTLEIVHRCLEYSDDIIAGLEKAVRIMGELSIVDHGSTAVQLFFMGFIAKLKTY